MASYIVKSKHIDLSKEANNKYSIGKFYSGDRFYTLLNEYIDLNLKKQNIFVAWVINVLFKSSNFKHDPAIANGYPLSVKLFDWFCIGCLIAFICLIATTPLMGVIFQLVQGKGFDLALGAILGSSIPAIITGIPAIFWLWIYFAIRKKNQPLTLQAFVEKKISYCLKLRFLIKNIEIKIPSKGGQEIIILENFEAQGTQAPRWLNIQMINLICSIFPHFNYIFKFDQLTDDEYKDLSSIVNYDFRNLDLIPYNDVEIDNWAPKKKTKWAPRKKASIKKNSKKIN